MDSILTTEELRQILCEDLKSDDFVLLNSSLISAAKHEEGFFGDSHILKLSFESSNVTDERIYFVKVLPESEVRANLAKSLHAYEKEQFLYKYLMKEFEKFGYCTDFAPKCYICKETKVIVMENLAVQNYKTRQLYDLQQCKSTMESLATFHGASFLYEEDKSEELGRPFRLGHEYSAIFQEYFFTVKERGFISSHMKISIKCLHRLIDFFPLNDDEKKLFMKYIEDVDIDAMFKEDLGQRKCCSHGDLWRRNIMLQEETNHCKLIDYQTLRYYYPAFDVLSLIYYNTTKDLRDKHKEEIISHYYHCLSKTLRGAIESILPADQFKFSIKHFEFLSVFQAAAGHQLDIKDDVDILSEERIDCVVNYFKKSEQYRNVLVNDINSLIDCVFERINTK